MSNKLFTVERECEVRFEVEPGWTARVSVTRGSAELFGVAMAPGEPYELGEGRFAVSTWSGADVMVEERALKPEASPRSPLGSAYVTEDPSSTTSLVAALNVHARLEREREEAQATGKRGPVVLVCGPTDSGKSTLTRVLLAYAARRGRRPVFVDLDPGQNDVAPPGSVAAVTVDAESVSVEEGISSAGALVYFFGHASPGESLDGFNRTVDRLAGMVEKRMKLDPASRASGVVINTCGWVEGPGYRLLTHAISAFKADVVLVMGQDRLLSDLKRDMARDAPATNILKIPTSGGASQRTREFRKRTRDGKIREYFYGSSGMIARGAGLSPPTLVVSFDDVELYRGPTKDDISDESMRPVGKSSLLDANRARRVEPTVSLQHSLVGVSHAASPDEMLVTNVAGFVHVQQVDVEKRRITLLCPQGAGASLPSKLLLVGGASVKWIDE